MTELQNELLKQWIRNHTYSSESHITDQGKCEWLRADELIQYLPTVIDYIILNNKLP